MFDAKQRTAQIVTHFFWCVRLNRVALLKQKFPYKKWTKIVQAVVIEPVAYQQLGAYFDGIINNHLLQDLTSQHIKYGGLM